MERITMYLLGLIVLVASTEAQRNLPFPTTKQPTSTQPTPSTAAPPEPTTPEATTPEATTPVNAPYPAAGYRPGRAFNLPTEERNAEVPDSSYGPPTEAPTEEPTTADNAPYPPSGYRPGKAFNLPTEERMVPETSYGPPTEQPPEAPAPYPPAGYRPNRAFNLPTENEDETKNLAESGYLPPELDQSPAGTEIVTSVRFPDSNDNGFNDVELARISSGRGVLQSRPSGFRQPERVVDHRFIRPGPNTLQPIGSNNFQPIGPVHRPLRPARRPLRPVNPPIRGAQTVLQTRPSFGFNSGVVFEREPVLITTIRLPDPFSFTSFLDDF